LVVLVTPNVSDEVRAALHPTFCTRIVEVDPISFPTDALQAKQVVSSHVESWGKQGSLTKLHIFRLDVYGTIVYLDADTLVVKDVSGLLELGKMYQESEALLAAAPDIFPPDKFNAGVLVVRPSQSVFDNMMQQRSLLATYDGGDTGFLNAYFSEWFTAMPPFSRLSFGYNAQRFLHKCTYAKQPNYWDLAVAPDLHIIHYSSSPKPWEMKVAPAPSSDSAQKHLDKDDVKTLQKVAKTEELEALWWKWYQRAQNYSKLAAAKREEKRREEQEALAVASAATAKRKTAPLTPKDTHKIVTKRYKELRSQGLNPKEAMKQARIDVGANIEEPTASSQVAAMFGLSGL